MEKEVQLEVFDATRKEQEYVPWRFDSKGKISNEKRLAFKDLTSICGGDGLTNVPQFSPNITASINFYQNYIGQKKYIGMFLKPVHALLFERVGDKLSCRLLTQEESLELQNLNKYGNGSSWISTTQHSELAGKIPEDVRNSLEYQEIIEQARYFNGEFQLLAQADAANSWLAQQSNEKIDFFQQNLSICRETLPSHIQQLRTIFSVNKKVYQFIAQSPAIDRSDYDWINAFPGCQASDIDNYRAVSKAFNTVAENWNSEDLETRQWDCPLYALGYIRQYIVKLKEFKSLWKLLQVYSNQSHKPASIAALLNEKQSTFFNDYILNNADPDKKDYDLIVQLIKEIPALLQKKDKAILSTLAEIRFIPYITNEQISAILSQPEIELKEWLLSNQTREFSQTQVELILKNHPVSELNQAFIQKATDYASLLFITQTLCASNKVVDDTSLLKIATHPCADDTILSLVVSKMTNSEHINDVISHLNAGEKTYAMGIKNEKTHSMAIETIAKKTMDPETFALCMTHQNADDKVFSIYFTRNEVKHTLLGLIGVAEKTKEVNYLRLAWSTASDKSQIVNAAFKNVSDDVQIFQFLAEIADNEASLQSILKKTVALPVLKTAFKSIHATQKVKALVAEKVEDSEFIEEIIKDAHSEEIYKIAANNGKTNQRTLLEIVKNTTREDVLKTVIGRSVDTEILKTVFRSPHADDKVKALVAEKTEDIAFIEEIIKGTQSEEIYKAVLKKEKFNQAILVEIAKNAADKAMLKYVVGSSNDTALLKAAFNNLNVDNEIKKDITARTQDGEFIEEIIKSIQSKALHEALYKEAANNKHTNQATLLEIATKTEDKKVLWQCIEHHQTGNDIFKIYLQRKGGTSTTDELEAIANKTTDKYILADIAKNTKNEALLQKLLKKNPDSVVLKAVLQRTMANDTLATIAELTHDASLLLSIVRKSIDSNVLKAAWENPLADNNLKILIAENAKSKDMLKYVVSNSNDTAVFKVAFYSFFADKEIKKDITARTQDSEFIEEIIENIQSKALHEALYKEAVNNEHTNQAALLQIATNTEDREVLWQCIEHHQTGNDIFKIYLQREGETSTTDELQAIVNKTTNRYILADIAKNTKNEALLQKLLKKNPDSVVLKAVLERTAANDTLAMIAELTHDEEILRNVAKKASKVTLLQTIIKKSTQSSILRAAFENSHADNNIKRFIAEKTDDAGLLFSIVTNSADSDTLKAVFRNARADEKVKKLLAEKTEDIAFVEEIIKGTQSEEIYKAALKKEKINEEILVEIAKNTRNREILSQCILHKRANEDVYRKYLDREDQLHSSLGLNVIANRTRDVDLLKDVTQKTKDSYLIFNIIVENDIHAEGVYLAAINNIQTNVDTLVEIAKRTEDPESLSQCLAHEQAGDAVFKEYLKRDSLHTSSGFSSIVKRTHNKDILAEIVKKTNDKHVFSSIVKATNNTDILAKILEKTNDKHLFASLLEKSKDNQDFFEIIINNPSLNDLLLGDENEIKATNEAITSNKKFIEKARNILSLDLQSKSLSPELISSINELQHKALSFCKQSKKTDDKYDKAFKAAFFLYISIKNAATSYGNKKISDDEFQNIVTKSIDMHKPVLETHRGFKKFLEAIAKLFGLELKTKTSNTLDKIKASTLGKKDAKQCHGFFKKTPSTTAPSKTSKPKHSNSKF